LTEPDQGVFKSTGTKFLPASVALRLLERRVHLALNPYHLSRVSHLDAAERYRKQQLLQLVQNHAAAKFQRCLSR